MDKAGRFRLPKEWRTKWAVGKKLKLMPLHWCADLDLPSEFELEAWLLFDPADNQSYDGWDVSPDKVEQSAADDRTAANLAGFILDVTVEAHLQGRRITLPKNLWNLGWISKAGGSITIKLEEHGISLWSDAAFRSFAQSLKNQWLERERDGG